MSRRAFFVLLMLAFLDSSAFGLIYPLFSSMLFDLRWHFVAPETSAAIRGLWLGIFIAATPLVAMLVSPFVGNLSDRLGRRPVIIACLCFGSISWLGAAYCVQEELPYGIAIARITMGLSVASFGVANACIADISDPKQKGRRYSWMGMAFGAGYAIGPLIGAVCASETAMWGESLVRPFIVASILTGLNTLLVFLWLPETFSRSTVQKDSQSLLSFIQDISKIDPKILCMLFATFLFCFGWSFYIDFIPVWWVNTFHLTTTQVSLFFGYGDMWYVLSCGLLVGPILRRRHPMEVFPVAAAGLFLSIWVLFLINTPMTYWWLLPLQNIAASFLFPVAATAVSEMASKEHQGKIMGYHASAEALGFGVGPLTSGPALGINLLMPVAIGGLAVLIAGAIVMRLRKALRSNSPS
jgi:MFS transporter, DHA1 family, tetracycline resistance protein